MKTASYLLARLLSLLALSIARAEEKHLSLSVDYRV
jgi:hypothetical protein